MPLVVKFADSQKDKDQKKSTSTPQLGGGGGSPAPFGATTTFDQTAAAIGAPALSVQGLQVEETYFDGGLYYPCSPGPPLFHAAPDFCLWRVSSNKPPSPLPRAISQ